MSARECPDAGHASPAPASPGPSNPGPHEVGLSRRRLFAVGAVAAAGMALGAAGQEPAGAVESGAVESGAVEPGAAESASATPTRQQRAEIRELARRIDAGEGVRLANGTVAIEGWFLSADHVRLIRGWAGTT